MVTTLAIITILAALLLSYLISVQLDKQSMSNYGQAIKAEEVAQSAMQQIVSGLLQEIDAGSSANASDTVNGIRIYPALTNSTSVPARLGFPATDFSTDVDSTGAKLPPSLLQVSRYNANYPAGYDTAKLPSLVASDVSTTNVSANRRRVTPARWNKPQLFGAQPAQPFSAKPPDWIYVTRSGTRVCSDTEAASGSLWADPGGANANAVLGRYAYVIYDQGSLLDINVAGLPQAAVAAEPGATAGKSYVSYADLSVIPGLSQSVIDQFVSRRNQGGSTLFSPWSNLLTQSARKGFLQQWAGDNPLLSRQDMLDFLSKKAASEASPYLSTFSRSANAPSARPTTPAGSTVNYGAEADMAGKANRNLANVRAPSDLVITHYDDAGGSLTYPIAKGSPLLQRRFSLAKLAWITRNGNASGISDAAIRASFGLNWDNANKRWNYVELANPMPSDHAIKTLDVVAAEGREPNFFELLKAGILSGSLGRDPGPKDTASPDQSLANNGVMGFGFEQSSAVKDAQIFRIGASIIDQADADSYPTMIYCRIFDGLNPGEVVNTFAGIENLPYLHRLHQIVMATSPGSYTNGIKGRLGAWLQPELWNPHQLPATSSGARPARFRVRTYGLAMTTWFQWIHVGSGSTMQAAYNTGTPSDFEGTEQSKGIIYFGDPGGSSSAFVNNPVTLTTSIVDTSATDPDCLFDVPSGEYPHVTGTGRSNPFAAIYSGESAVPFTPKSETDSDFQVFGRTRPTNEFSVVLEFQDEAGIWHPYSQMLRLQGISSASVSSTATDETKIVGSTAARLFYNHADARTDRFSLSGDWPQSQGSPATTFSTNRTIWPSSSGAHSVKWFLPRIAGFTYGAGSPYYLGDWQINTSTSRARYSSPDGIIRPADGFRGTDSTGDGRQTFSGGVSSPRRPVILDRPFRSVGELGYVFRDEPFKTLDFWSEQSGDSMLLDVFSLTDEPSIVTGRLQLNNSPQTVIQAVLRGAGKNAANPGTAYNIPDSLAKNLASAIALKLRSDPLLNNGDIATKLSASIQTAMSSTEDRGNKTYAETPMRALAAVTDTRTWNLLIDVIAQSGRMGPKATNLSQFLVEGEKRYWLHVAIDRVTGEIIGQQLEPVYE
ncbi:hypothetical protein [Terrimicrobium sacchariphilum]|uniref:hypothetical protein n=1 Tax=Terrimicrobium sacchariphilum TaxID=690879 RepID=UPI00094624C1|nr:hypothetical protein [Terrimicrobium sacchariphilum]